MNETNETAKSTVEDPIFVFPEDVKTTTVPLEVLRCSKMILGKGEVPVRNRPVQSWELIQQCAEAAINANLSYELGPIYIQRGSSYRVVTKEEREKYNETNMPASKWLFDKIITSLQFHHKDDIPETNPAVVISYHEKGITLAWGLHVSCCSNFNIYGGECLYTFGVEEQKESYESVMIRFKDWLARFEEMRAKEIAIKNRFQNTQITNRDVLDTIIGALYQAAIKQAYFRGEKTPFTINDMSTFVQAILTEQKEKAEEGEETFLVTLDDLYNLGTSIMKPGIIDIADIAECSKLFSEFLQERFFLNNKNETI